MLRNLGERRRDDISCNCLMRVKRPKKEWPHGRRSFCEVLKIWDWTVQKMCILGFSCKSLNCFIPKTLFKCRALANSIPLVMKTQLKMFGLLIDSSRFTKLFWRFFFFLSFSLSFLCCCFFGCWLFPLIYAHYPSVIPRGRLYQRT